MATWYQLRGLVRQSLAAAALLMAGALFPWIGTGHAAGSPGGGLLPITISATFVGGPDQGKTFTADIVDGAAASGRSGRVTVGPTGTCRFHRGSGHYRGAA